jgi:hypothetical protein
MGKTLCACAVIAVVSGCSAAGLPISEPEHVTTLATDISQSELEAIAWSIHDVVTVAVKSLLRAPPGAVTEQLTSAGTLTIGGTAAQPGDAAETLALTLAFDGYQPKVDAAVTYPDWRLSSAEPSTLTLDFTNISTNDGGDINGAFAGTVALAPVKRADASSNVEARLAIHGLLPHAGDPATSTLLHVSGVIYAAAFGYYYNDASVPYKSQ